MTAQTKNTTPRGMLTTIIQGLFESAINNDREVKTSLRGGLHLTVLARKTGPGIICVLELSRRDGTPVSFVELRTVQAKCPAGYEAYGKPESTAGGYILRYLKQPRLF